MRTRWIFGLLASLLLASSAMAADDAQMLLARRYMQAYDALDAGGMGELLAEDVQFSDRTTPPEYGGPAEHDGKAALLAAIGSLRSKGGMRELGLQWQQVFSSGDQVVFIGQVNALALGRNGGWLRWRTGLVTAVTIQNGKIVRHQDFADYPAAVTEPALPAPSP